MELCRPLIMGIVNVTPDSFSDGARFLDPQRAIDHANQLIEEGADIIDVGAESSRPGARPVSVNEELDRLLPVLHGLRAAPVPLSVDTVKPAVMRVSIQEGASFINDINALRADGAIEVVAASTAGICFMHMKGHPGNMQESPTYADVVAEVAQFLSARVEAALASGIDRDRISVDPGFGFGKTAAHNMQILRELGKIGAIGQPVVFGASRKSTLGAVTGREVTRREPASIAAAVLAIERGASMVRVHDVAATRDAIAVWQAMRGKTMNPTNDIVREVL